MNKKFLLKFICTIILSSLIIIFMASSFKAFDSSNSKEDYKIIVVEKGDTLWNIVKGNCHNYKDIRDAIYSVKKYNNLTTVNIYPGQKIKIPLKLYR